MLSSQWLRAISRNSTSCLTASQPNRHTMSKRAGPLVLAPRGQHVGTVIFLHGLGDTGFGWEDVGVLVQRKYPGVKFILPHAPHRPITINGGMRMPGWYDIAELSDRGTTDVEGLNETRKTIEEMIAEEMNTSKLPSNKIVLGGFSQGAASTLYTALQMEQKLGGIIVLSGYLPLAEQFKPTDTNKGTPILMGHGDSDEVVQFSWGKKSHDKLEQLGVSSIDFRVYPGMGHSACMEEIEDIGDFVKKTLF